MRHDMVFCCAELLKLEAYSYGVDPNTPNYSLNNRQLLLALHWADLSYRSGGKNNHLKLNISPETLPTTNPTTPTTTEAKWEGCKKKKVTEKRRKKRRGMTYDMGDQGAGGEKVGEMAGMVSAGIRITGIMGTGGRDHPIWLLNNGNGG